MEWVIAMWWCFGAPHRARGRKHVALYKLMTAFVQEFKVFCRSAFKKARLSVSRCPHEVWTPAAQPGEEVRPAPEGSEGLGGER